MIPRNLQEIHTFNFGQPGCRDEYYARKIAEVAGTQHHYYPYENGNWVRELVDFHLEMTEGFQPWIHMHGMNMLSTVRDYVDVNLSGLGDLLWLQPHFVPRHVVDAPDDIAFNSLLFELYSQKYSWPGMTYAEERYLYTESYYSCVNGLALESFANELKPFENLPYLQRIAAFNLNNQFSRHLLYSGVVGRSHIEYRFPYFDLSLMSFCYGLPYEVGNSRILQRAIIEREMPALARVPYEDDELPITSSGSIRALHYLKNRVKRVIHRTILPVFPYRRSLYADYEKWLRTDLRQWAEEILFDERTLSRGIFRPEALRSLMDRHMSGREPALIGKIAPLITFEMMARRYVD
jgi:asparagine synthase (glutamine-hydrolysing)